MKKIFVINYLNQIYYNNISSDYRLPLPLPRPPRPPLVPRPPRPRPRTAPKNDININKFYLRYIFYLKSLPK